MPTLSTIPGDVQIAVSADPVDVYLQPPQDPNDLTADAQKSGRFYTRYRIETEYRTETGLEISPSAGPFATSATLSTTTPNPAYLAAQPPADFGPGPANLVNNYYGYAPAQSVHLFQPYTVKTVTWLAERFAAPPVCPHWNPQVAPNGQPALNADGTPRGNANEFLRRKRVKVLSPVLSPDGVNFVQRVRGVYVYGLYYPVEDGDTVWTGSLPTDNATAEFVAYNGLIFDRTILRSLPPQSATVAGAVVAAQPPQG